MPKLTPREMFLKSKGLYTRDMTPEEIKRKKQIVSSLENKMPYFKKKYGERAQEVMDRIAIKRAKMETNKKRTTLKDSYKSLLTNMLNEEKHHISSEDFQKLAVKLSGLNPKELDITIMSSHGDDFTPRDMINHHSNMLYRSLVAGSGSHERHTKALAHHKVDVDALIKHFHSKKKDDK